jgi:hypothetical protein
LLRAAYQPIRSDLTAGVIVDIRAGAGAQDSVAPAGAGGWELGYGMSKGALQRIAGIFDGEVGDLGIRARTSAAASTSSAGGPSEARCASTNAPRPCLDQ